MIKGCSKSGEKDCFCCSFCFIHSKFVLLMKKRISAYPRKIGSFLGRSFVLWRYRQDDIMSAERRSEENAAVALAAPVLLAFNAVNNLFGVGSSSMMSRALGRRDYDTVYRSSAFGFYCCIICSIIFSIICTVGKNPLLGLLGAEDSFPLCRMSLFFHSALQEKRKYLCAHPSVNVPL